MFELVVKGIGMLVIIVLTNNVQLFVHHVTEDGAPYPDNNIVVTTSFAASDFPLMTYNNITDDVIVDKNKHEKPSKEPSEGQIRFKNQFGYKI